MENSELMIKVFRIAPLGVYEFKKYPDSKYYIDRNTSNAIIIRDNDTDKIYFIGSIKEFYIVRENK